MGSAEFDHQSRGGGPALTVRRVEQTGELLIDMLDLNRRGKARVAGLRFGGARLSPSSRQGSHAYEKYER